MIKILAIFLYVFSMIFSDYGLLFRFRFQVLSSWDSSSLIIWKLCRVYSVYYYAVLEIAEIFARFFYFNIYF